MKEIILASGSPRRKKLLCQIVSDFKIEPSNFDEQAVFDLEPHELVKFLSREKAETVAADAAPVIPTRANANKIFFMDLFFMLII